MIFDPSHWAVVQRIIADKELLLKEFNDNQHHIKSKVTMTTPVGGGKPLFDLPMDVLVYTLDPLLWTPEEIKNVGLTSNNRIWPKYSPNIGVQIAKDFPCIRQLHWSTLKPNGRINPHWGINGVLQNKIPDHWRLQICWLPGNNVRFHLNNEYIEYAENTIFGFCDGLDLHWVENNGTESRTTLIIDVHKHLVESANIPHYAAVYKN